MGKDFRSEDVWLIGYLVLNGATFEGFEDDPIKYSRYQLVVSGEDLEEAAREYYAGSMVPVVEWKSHVLKLKRALYEYQSEERATRRSKELSRNGQS